MKRSAWQRSFELAKMAAKVGLQEIRSGDLKSRIEQARVITESLAQLKGAAMKAGQLLSIEIGDYFPPEAQEILSRLQNAAAPVSFQNIYAILRREFGEDRVKLLKELSVEPAAAASIGQIHTARLNEHRLALKVQYDGVAESIDADLKILRKLAEAFCSLTGRSMDLGQLFSEFREVLSQEVDYLQEAEYLKRYNEKLKTIPDSTANLYFVPQALPEWTTKKVLTMTWEDGLPFRQWLQTQPSREAREQVAHLILNLYCYEFFSWGLVQTDPNFANFLVRNSDAGPTLVLLDFGATRQYAEEFITQYVALLRVAGGPEPQKVVDQAISFGLLDPRESREAKNNFISMMEVAIQPFFIYRKSGEKTSRIFKFADSDYAKLSQETVRRFARSLNYTPPPHKLIFLHRKLGGIFSILKNLKVELDVTPYWERMISRP